MDPNGPKGLKKVQNAEAFLAYDYGHTEFSVCSASIQPCKALAVESSEHSVCVAAAGVESKSLLNCHLSSLPLTGK